MAVEIWKNAQLLQPSAVSKLCIPPHTTPIRHLALYRDGIGCRLCLDGQAYICRTRNGMQAHLRSEHDWKSPQGKGRQSRAARLAETAYTNVVVSPLSCQTFYQQSQYVRFFQVDCPEPGTVVDDKEQGTKPAAITAEPSRSALELVAHQLDQKLQALHESTQAEGLTMRQSSQVDPWLDITMWEQYLHGYDLITTARLIALPLQLAEDQLLDVILASFDRLIEQTRMFILQGEFNIFDLHRVNNFVSCHSSMRVVMTKHEKRAMIRPLLSKLLESTYKKYKGVWKRMLCFIYRLVHQQQQQPALHYVLTDGHVVAKASYCNYGRVF